jgi:hypothetical protein
MNRGCSFLAGFGYKLRDLIKTSFDRKQIGSKSDVSPHLQKSFDFSAAQWGKIFRQAAQSTPSTAGVLPADFSGIVERARDPFRGDRCSAPSRQLPLARIP